MASDTFLFDCAQQMQTQIRNHVDLTGDGSFAGIPSDHVRIWSLPYNPSSPAPNSTPASPACLITPPRRIISPPEAGENCEDWVISDYLIQLTDRSASDINDEARIAQWLKWQWRIHRHFHMSNLRNQIVDVDNEGQLQLVWCEEVDVIDEKQFAMCADAVAVIPVRVRFARTRDATGSV